MKTRSFNYSQAIVALGLVALGAFLLMTGTALIAVVFSTAALFLVFIHFLVGEKSERPPQRKTKPKPSGGAA